MAQLPTSSTQPTVACPKCGTSVRLDDALAAPLLQAARAEFEERLEAERRLAASERDAREAALAEQSGRLRSNEERLKTREAEVARRIQEANSRLAQSQADLQTQRAGVEAEIERKAERRTEEQLRERLGVERKLIAEAEARRAAERLADELAARDRRQSDQQQRIEQLTARVAASQQAEAQFLREKQELADREAALKLEVEQEISGRVGLIRAEAVSQAEERLSLQIADKDRAINDLRDTIEGLQRKAQQGSQQSQGETLELLLEDQLRRKFPFDLIQPVEKGESGADILQIVRDESAHECGRILWESKRTKNWSPGWLPKLRGDQRAAKADLAVLISQAMPPDVQHFNEVDGVWVSSISCTVPVAVALRASLLQLSGQRRATEGQQSKSEMVYSYLTGPHFRSRIDAISERWREMRKDLDDERRATLLRWKKREKQLEILLESTTGIMGDLHGITGQELPEIEALESMLLLE